jgi:hypothetical protein
MEVSLDRLLNYVSCVQPAALEHKSTRIKNREDFSKFFFGFSSQGCKFAFLKGEQKFNSFIEWHLDDLFMPELSKRELDQGKIGELCGAPVYSAEYRRSYHPKLEINVIFAIKNDVIVDYAGFHINEGWFAGLKRKLIR